jgi:predicted metal-binding protein
VTRTSSCIYCASKGKLSKEHWFPESFGKFRNYVKLICVICVRCNGETKVAEQALARYGVSGIYRSLCGIKGKRRPEKRFKSPF